MTHHPSAASIWRAYNRAENDHDHGAMVDLLSGAIEIWVNGGPALSSAEDDRLAMEALFAAYPDYRREILDVVDGGASAAIRWRMRGNPAAALAGRLDPLDLEGCSIVEVEDGRIVRAWLYSTDGPIRRVLDLARSPGGSTDD